MTLCSHGGQQRIDQLKLTEYVGFEQRSQGVSRQVLYQAWYGIGAVVEQGVQRASGQFKCVTSGILHAFAAGIVK